MRDQKSACPRLGKGISLNGQPHMKIGGMFNNGESQSSHLCGDHRRVLALDTHLQVAKRDGGNLSFFRKVCGIRDHILLPYRSFKLCHLVLLIVYWEVTNLFPKVIRMESSYNNYLRFGGKNKPGWVLLTVMFATFIL